MIGDARVLALIPARGGSKGLPGKNLRPLQGEPLVTWPIRTALGATHVDRVVLTTDDPEIRAAGLAAGAEAPFLRPAHLASDEAPSSGAILHALDWLEAEGEAFDYFVLLEPPSPLTESADVDAALARLGAARPSADAIVGVALAEAAHPAFLCKQGDDGLLSPYLPGGFDDSPRRQDIGPVFFMEGSLYASTVAAYRERRTFYHQRTLPYVVPRWKSLEVDELVDFVCVEAILNHRAQLREEPA